MSARPANVVAWMGLLVFLAVGGFVVASIEWQAILVHIVDPVHEASPHGVTFLADGPSLTPADIVREKAGVAVLTDVFLVLPVAILAVVACAAPAGERRAGWLIGAATVAAFVTGVVLTRAFVLVPLQESSHVFDQNDFFYRDIPMGQYLLFFAGTLLIGGICLAAPAVYALGRMRSEAAPHLVAAFGVAILAVILGTAVMPQFDLSPISGYLATLGLAFAAVVAVERLARIQFSQKL